MGTIRVSCMSEPFRIPVREALGHLQTPLRRIGFASLSKPILVESQLQESNWRTLPSWVT